MLRGLTLLVFFQLLGTVVNVLALPLLPGPIIGMLLLLVYLMVQGGVSADVSVAAMTLLRYLPLLLVPPVAGVMVYWQVLGEHIWAIMAAMIISLLVAVAFCGWLMQFLIERKAAREARHDA